MARQSRVVIVGAGVAGLETALALHNRAGEAIAIELVAPETEFTYRPLAVLEPFRAGDVLRLPLRTLADAAAATLRHGRLAAVAADEKAIELEDGETLTYDALVLAVGARPRQAVAGALTFRGPEDSAALAELVDQATSGNIRKIVFAVPAAATWPVPLYELALLTANYLADRLAGAVEVAVVTREDRPLALFGVEASDAIRELLAIRGIILHCGAIPMTFADRQLRLAGGAVIEADAAVALPRLEGPRIAGVPQDKSGFVPTDEFGWVLGLTDVYAAGDLTQFPVKQGGIATQQADAVASAIAAGVSAAAKPTAFKPVLRGLLLTGRTSRFLRAGTRGDSVVDTEPLWWPPAKIVGRCLTPLLAQHLELEKEFHAPPVESGIPVEVELETLGHADWTAV
jgi:sulfide:quinone oxidoreductase